MVAAWAGGHQEDGSGREVVKPERPQVGLAHQALLSLHARTGPSSPPSWGLPYLNKLLRGSEAAHAERHEDPAPGVAALGGVVGELLADLAVDLIPRQEGTTSEEQPQPHPSRSRCDLTAVSSNLPKTIQEEAERGQVGEAEPSALGSR